MDDVLIDTAVSYGIPASLVVLAFIVGSWVERRHFRRLAVKEDALRDLMAFAIRRVPKDLVVSDPQLVCGSAVISIDYFKKFAADLRGIVGGRIGAYESLFERARREAIVRMKEDAKSKGAHIVLNLKIDTARIYASGRAVVSVEAVAYGTAYAIADEAIQIH